MTAAGLRRHYLSRQERRDGRAVLTPEGTALAFTIAGAGDRIAAFLVDFSLICLALFFLLIVASMAWTSAMGQDWVGPFVLLALFFLRNFYFAFFELRWQGRTPGKRVARIRVVDAHGGPLTADAILGRNLVRELEIWTPLVLLFAQGQVWPGAPGWLRLAMLAWILCFAFMPLFNRDRLRVGDLIAGTMVVRAPRTILEPDLGGAEMRRQKRQGVEYRFTRKQLAVYGIYELQVLEELLRGGNRIDNRKALDAVCLRIKRKIKWDRKNWKVPPERFLTQFYAALRAHLEQNMLLGKRKEDKYSK